MLLSPLKILLWIVFSLLSSMTYSADLAWTNGGNTSLFSNSLNWSPTQTPSDSTNLTISDTTNGNRIFWDASSAIINSLILNNPLLEVSIKNSASVKTNDLAIGAGKLTVNNFPLLPSSLTVMSNFKISSQGQLVVGGG